MLKLPVRQPFRADQQRVAGTNVRSIDRGADKVQIVVEGDVEHAGGRFGPAVQGRHQAREDTGELLCVIGDVAARHHGSRPQCNARLVANLNLANPLIAFEGGVAKRGVGLL